MELAPSVVEGVGILIGRNLRETLASRGLWFPPFAKDAKDGAPTFLVMPARSKAWPLDFVLLLEFRDNAKIFERRGVALDVSARG